MVEWRNTLEIMVDLRFEADLTWGNTRAGRHVELNTEGMATSSSSSSSIMTVIL